QLLHAHVPDGDRKGLPERGLLLGREAACDVEQGLPKVGADGLPVTRKGIEIGRPVPPWEVDPVENLGEIKQVCDPTDRVPEPGRHHGRRCPAGYMSPVPAQAGCSLRLTGRYLSPVGHRHTSSPYLHTPRRV